MSQQIIETIREFGENTKKALGEERRAREKLEGDVKEVRDVIQRYIRQPPLGGGDGPDPSYKGKVFQSRHQAKQFGEFCKAVITGERESLKAMGIGSDPAGGYLIQETLADSIISHVNTYGVARKLLTPVPMSSDRQRWPKRTGGFTVRHPDEGQAGSFSDLAFGSVLLNAKRWQIPTLVSDELDEGSVVALGELLAREFALAIATAEDNYTFNGDGTSDYAGITGVFNSPNVGVVTMPSTKTAFTDLAYSDLVNLIAAVPDWVLTMPDCGWFVSSGIHATILLLRDSSGQPFFANTQAGQGLPPRILDFPVYRANTLPQLSASAAGKKFIAFGSLSAWGFLGARNQMAIRSSRDLKMLEGQVVFMVNLRQDIQEQDGGAMAVLRTAAS